MKTLVIGCNGQLGVALSETVPAKAEIIGFDLPELDISDAAAVMDVCRRSKASVIINAAAYTAVDHAESNREKCQAVNADGPRNLAVAADEVGARLIHISTDFVFDGDSSTPYKTNDATNPLSTYGRTKRDGEQAVLETLPASGIVLRTAWLYSKTGSNFVKTMLRLMQERDELSVVSDQIGTPTWANSLAMSVWAFAGSVQLSGIFHWTDGGQASWYEFALAIQEEAHSLGLLDKMIPLRKITSEDYPTAATRPKYSVLDCSALWDALTLSPADWRANLHQMLEELKT
jgi:dTDP-4-dehydrorhamnose reductase